jgi:5'-3' exonuclease
MGIPSFYSWLRRRYPLVTSDAGPGGIDFLYIDLNSLLYPCL